MYPITMATVRLETSTRSAELLQGMTLDFIDVISIA